MNKHLGNALLTALLAGVVGLGSVLVTQAQFVNPGSRSRPNPAFGGCTFYTTPPTLLNSVTGPVLCDARGQTFEVIRDAAGNLRGANVTAGNALQHDVTSIAGNAALAGNGVTGTGSQRVTVASDNTPFAVKIDQTTPGTTNLVAAKVTGNAGGVFDQVTGSAVPANALYNGLNVAGNLRGLTGSNPTGSVFAAQTDLVGVNGVTALAGNGVTGTGSLRVTIASDTTANSNPYLVQSVPGTASGLTTASAVAANSNNSTSVKGSAGLVYSVMVTNNSATIAYFKLFNKTTAPTCGSDTPVWRMMVPASSGFVFNSDQGLTLGTGIGYCLVTGIADADNTSVAASAYLINVGYK